MSATLSRLLDEVYERETLPALVQYAQRQGAYCCTVGCGGGACEVCPCCCAGWCVSGIDGIPEDPEDRSRWIEVAAEHNPVAQALADQRARYEAVADELDDDRLDLPWLVLRRDPRRDPWIKAKQAAERIRAVAQ